MYYDDPLQSFTIRIKDYLSLKIIPIKVKESFSIYSTRKEDFPRELLFLDATNNRHQIRLLHFAYALII